jgi:hypothetical protein
MSARFKTKQHTLSGSAESLSDILDDPRVDFLSSLTIRAAHANTGNINWEDSDSSSGGFIQPGEGADWELAGKFVRATDIYFNGTASDVLDITVIS